MSQVPSQADIFTAVSKSLEKKDISKQAVTVLQKSTEKVLKRIKQNVDAQIKEDSSPIVEDFVKNIASKLSTTSQQWVDSAKNDLLVYPEGTKYIFRDGDNSTIIVEQQPQLRHVKVRNAVGEATTTYMLAMPYIQFIISFVGEKLQQKLTVTCSKKSITDLNVPHCHLPLLNIENHNVCFGHNWPKDGTMTEKVNAMIGEFWQSQFNFNHSGSYINFIKANFSRGVNSSNFHDGLAAWENASKRDALFMVSPTTILSVGHSPREFLSRDNTSATGTGSLVTKLKQEILTAVGTIGGDIQNLLTNIDLTTENLDKVHTENLQEVLKEIITQAYTELWTFTERQLEADRKKLQEEMQVAANKLRKEFENYIKDQKTKTW